MKRKGQHPHRALSAVRVNSIKAPGRYADGNGLYLLVDPSGAKRWILRTIVRGRGRTDLGLGG
ncbi:MAG: Arm DNA-binding domain-containing protein, partial [Sulfuricaulis sp.]|nr:Arm DNA-binding domain-containing protein [Sulfuricaulis sp.]